MIEGFAGSWILVLGRADGSNGVSTPNTLGAILLFDPLVTSNGSMYTCFVNFTIKNLGLSFYSQEEVALNVASMFF